MKHATKRQRNNANMTTIGIEQRNNANMTTIGIEEEDENMKTIPLTVNGYIEVPTKQIMQPSAPTFVHPTNPTLLDDDDDDDDDDNDYDFESEDSSDEGSDGQTLIRIRSMEGIVRGFETTVLDEEHLDYEYLPRGRRNSFSSMLRQRISYHLLINDDESYVNSPTMRKCKNASLNIIFRLIKWLKSLRYIRFKRATVFIYLGFILLTLRAGELRMFANDNWSDEEVEASGLYRSTWGDTVTYYGIAQDKNYHNHNMATRSRHAMAPHPAKYVANTNTIMRGPPTTLPKSFNDLADVSLPLRESDIPLFWHIPRSAGSTVKEMLSACFDMVLASEVGGHLGKTNEKSLKVVKHRGHKYVTVDTSSKVGIQRAKYLGLGDSEMVDVVVSLFLHDISSVFTPNHKGRLFTIFRHPVERSASLFYYLSVANWEKTYRPVYSKMSIEDYAKSTRVEYNWMTRFLSGDLNGEVTQDHLNIAKEVLRRKCLVGLLEQKEETFRRFYKYFHWDDNSLFSSSTTKNNSEEYKQSCISKVVFDDWPNRNQHPRLEEGSEVWEILKHKNYYDMELYEYAKNIFKDQSYLAV